MPKSRKPQKISAISYLTSINSRFVDEQIWRAKNHFVRALGLFKGGANVAYDITMELTKHLCKGKIKSSDSYST